MKDIELLLFKLNKIATDLEGLSHEFSDIHQLFEGYDFDNQISLSAILDNYVLTTTHEIASMIQFSKFDIKILTDYIDFRKAHKGLLDNELEEIIDSRTTNLALKLDLSKRIANGDNKLVIEKLQQIRLHWSNSFENRNYKDIRNKFLITTNDIS